jgi:histidinol dehydrogenase
VAVKATVGAKIGESVALGVGAVEDSVAIDSIGCVVKGGELQAPSTILRTTIPRASCFKFVGFMFFLTCKSS